MAEAEGANIEDRRHEEERNRIHRIIEQYISDMNARMTASSAATVAPQTLPPVEKTINSKTIIGFTIGELWTFLAVVASFVIGYFSLKNTVDKNSEKIETLNVTITKMNETLERQADVIEAVLLTDTVILKKVQEKRAARSLSK